MSSRWLKTIAAAALTCALWFSPAYAQRGKKKQIEQAEGPRKPVVEYIVVVVLLALPVGLVCRSSRR